VRRLSEALLITAYVLLVGVVAFGAAWISDKLNEADEDRCRILAIQSKIAVLELDVLIPPVGQVGNDDQVSAEAHARADEIRAEIAAVCPGV